MKRLKLVGFVLGALVLTVGQLAAVELLRNGDLEAAGNGPPGWTLQEFPSTGTGTFDTAEQIGFADQNGIAGEYGLWLKPFSGGAVAPSRLTNAVLSQTRQATPGERYTFTGSSRWEFNYSGGVTTLDPASPFGAIASPTRTEMELSFLNSGGNVIGSPYVLDLRTQQDNFGFWVQHDFNTTFGGGAPLLAPAGTTNVRVRAAMRDAAFNVDPQQSAFFDDFSLIAQSTAAEVLLNGNLDTAPTEFPFWNVQESPEGIDTVNAQSAVWAQNPNTSGFVGAFLHPWANGGLVADPNDATFTQTVAGVANGSYSYSVWTKFEQNFSGGVGTLSPTSPNGPVPSPTSTSMTIEFLDGNNVVISNPGPVTLDLRADRAAQGGGNANDSEWRQHTITTTSPAGTVTVRVSGKMNDGVFNIDPQQSAFLDDFSLVLNSALDGDFNNDGIYNCTDINSLTVAVANHGSVAQFDLNGDNVLSIADVDRWRSDAGAINIGPGRVYRVGDANLDGAVDGSDFGLWNSNKFTSNQNWCSGNFNADTVTDGSDFGLWNSNKFTSSDSSVVPEPSSGIACLFALLALGYRSRK